MFEPPRSGFSISLGFRGIKRRVYIQICINSALSNAHGKAESTTHVQVEIKAVGNIPTFLFSLCNIDVN